MRTLKCLQSLWQASNKEPFQTGFLFPVHLFILALCITIDVLMLCVWDMPSGIYRLIRGRIRARKEREANEIRQRRLEQEQVVFEQQRLEQQRLQAEATRRQTSDQERRIEARAQCELL